MGFGEDKLTLDFFFFILGWGRGDNFSFFLLDSFHITLHRFITMFCGTDSISWNIIYIRTECGECLGMLCGMLSVS